MGKETYFGGIIMARIEVIEVKDLDDYFRFERLRTELVLLLKQIESLSQLKLEKLKRVKEVARSLDILKSKHKIKLEEDLTKVVRKYARGY